MKIKELLNEYKLIILDKPSDIEIIKKYQDEIFNILKISYESIGSCSIYEDVKHMRRNVGRYKLIFKNDNLYAAATYRYFAIEKHSYKCTLIGGNNQYNKNDVNNAIIWIIKSDIINWKHLYWIEASGPIRHWYNKYGAFKMPNAYVEQILELPIEKVDDYAYTRYIVGIEDPVEKTMFGFDSLVSMQLMEADMYKYDEKIKQLYADIQHILLESINKTINININKLQKILHLIYFFTDQYEDEYMFFNVSEQTYKIMNNTLKIINIININTLNISQYDKDTIIDLFDMFEYIVKNANVIIPHKLF